MSRKPLLLLASLLAACSDDAASLDAGLHDGGPDALAVDAASTDAAPPPGCTCLALGVDYTNGVGTLAKLALPALTVTKDILPGGVSSDPVVRVLGDRVFIVNRYGGDNVVILRRADLSFVAQFATGSNPQDIAVKDDTALVPLAGAPTIEIWDLSAAPTKTGSMDISTYDTDGNPDASSVIYAAGSFFVTLELLDASYQATGPGLILKTDPTTHSVTSTLTLTDPNPYGFLVPWQGDDVLVATVGDMSGASGCLEVLHAAAGTTECLLSATTLSGTVSAIAPVTSGVYLAVGSNLLGTPTGTLGLATFPGGFSPFDRPGELITDVAACAATGQAVFADQTHGGLRVVGADGTEATTAALDIGLPPSYEYGIACW